MALDYDPGKVDLIFGGVAITGYAPGTFISVEREVDAYTKSVGSDGEVTRTRSRNTSGMVTVTLTQGSPSNRDLSLFAIADETTGIGVFPIMVKDSVIPNGSIYAAGEAWVRKVPNGEFGDEAATREWIFDCANLDMLTVGN